MVHRPFLGLRGQKLNAVVVFVAGVEFLLFGYDQGVMGGLLTLPSFTRVFPEICTTRACTADMTESGRSHQSTVQGIAVSSYNLGCFTGAILAMRFGQTFGRRWAIFIGCTLVSIGAILQFSAFGLAQFIVGRIICGMGTGINTSTVPVWQAETTKPHQRGPVIAFETSMVIAGVMISYWVDFGFSYTEPSSVAWRFPIAFQLVFALLVLGLILFMPESPRWLVCQDRIEDAAVVISVLYDLPEDDPLVADQLQAIRAIRQVDAKASISEMFIQGPLKNRTRTLLAISIQIFSQLSGINIITYYAATIYENEIGLSPFVSRLLAAGNGTQYFLASLFSVPIIKYFNRRPVIIMVTSGTCLSMVMLAILTSVGGRGPGIGAAAFLFVFNTFFGIGYAQLSWLYPAEVTPLSIRAQANALATSSNWICNFMVVMVTPVAFTNVGFRTYIIFAVLNFAAIPVMYLCYPETRGRSLEEVDLIFRNSKNLRQAVKLAFTMERHFDHKGKLLKSLAQDVEDEETLAKNGGNKVEHHEIINEQ